MNFGLLKKSPEIVSGYYQLIEAWHHPHFARWFSYMRVMQTFHEYEKIVLADTKDVVFQARFFDKIDPKTVSIFEDGESFNLSGWNGRWYLNAFGRKKYDEVSHRQPICIGVVAGGTEPILAFVSELCKSIARQPFGKIEQAIFNKMYFSGEFTQRFTVYPNASGPVLTMCGDDQENLADCRDGVVIHKNNEQPIPIVHMYDRYDAVKAAVRARYP